MRVIAAVFFKFCMTGCAKESAVQRAATMKGQDHAACAKAASDRGFPQNSQAYRQCRQSMPAYRQIDAQRQQNQGDALIEAGRALCGISGSPEIARAAGCP